MRRALHTLSPIDWLGSREAAAHGQTLSALADRGLARCAWTHRPHRRLVARLTPAGVLASHGPQGVSRSRDGLMLEALALDALEFGGPRGLTLMELAELCEATGGRPANLVELNGAVSRLGRRVRVAGGRYFATTSVRSAAT